MIRGKGSSPGKTNQSTTTALPMGGDADDDKYKSKGKKRVPRNPRSKLAASQNNPAQQLLQNPRLFLFVACLWPLAILALFASSAPTIDTTSAVVSPSSGNDGSSNSRLVDGSSKHLLDKFEVRKLLDRVDVMGYGPTHPRVAFVVVGNTDEEILESVKSIFSNTDLNRIFVVCAVLDDGKGDSPKLVKKLRKIENGSVPHWHGLKLDVHLKNQEQSNNDHGDNEDEDDEETYHHPKTHAIFHSTKQGLSKARATGAEFVNILVRTHEDAGFKSHDEDIILALVQGGSTLNDHKWLDAVTPALIVKPPLISLHKTDVAMKLANAISLHTEGQSKRTSFDARLAPIVSDVPSDEINLSSGKNFPTPALNGAFVVMRLGTFLNLPETDHSQAMDPWSANLDLSLNLWMCADGIDIFEDVEVVPPKGGIYPSKAIGLDKVASVASVWMDDLFKERFFQAYAASDEQAITDENPITRVDWDTAITKAKRLIPSSQMLYKRCRTFEWYIQEVNTDLSLILDTKLKEDHRFDSAIKAAEQIHSQEALKAKEDEQAKAEEKAKSEAAEAAKAEAEAAKAVAEKQPEIHIAPPDVNQNKNEEHKEGVAVERKKPSTPLRPFNLETVQKPKMVDISYVDVSGGHQEHPHLGALDANGNLGYMHDETALRNNPPPFETPTLHQQCAKRDGNYNMMHNRIVVETEYDEKMNESGKKRDKIFCLVYTIAENHDRIPNIRKTWGQKCDGFMVGSTKTDASIGAVNIPHEGPEEYGNIWQKVRSMWSYIYDNYYEKYDWFHIGGDDLFVLVENLRYYLESEEIRTASNGGMYLPEGNETMQTPLFLGRRFAYLGNMDEIFISGGSGYTMNKASLKLLVTELMPNYFPHRKTFSEDTMVAELLRKMSVFPYDTKDEAGGERYMPFDPANHLAYRLPKDPSKGDWYVKYSIDIKEGYDHCAPESVAFHYIKGDLMTRLFALAYGLCPKQ